MAELKDYSGNLKPDLKYEDFSKEALIKLLNEYARIFLATDGYWYSLIKQRYSDEEAMACELIVWDKCYTYDPRKISEAMNIKGHDVTACLKALSLSPGFPMGFFDWTIDLQNPNYAIVTVNRCPSLLYFEREGEGRDFRICHELEPAAFQTHANYFNPAIKVTPLKLPPRKSEDEGPFCIWEWKLQEIANGKHGSGTDTLRH
ncbi:MAG: DUF6125 family protein [Dehalococcoidia bacterium]|nr:DUF6125 family protein [Dehalococcoidia bacterium]